MADGTQALMQLAQANESGEAIGQISTSSGEVFITRTDGSEVKGGEGTEIFQGDMVRTGDGGDVSMVFADDTTFSLGGDAEMTIDEMVYDPGSESGSAAFSVAKGVFGFVSGQLAKVDPDAMVIDTPVATIGIRGSSGTGEAGPEGSENTFVLVPDPDGTIGEIIIQTETGSVVMNVPYQVSSVLSTFISPTSPVTLPASVVRQVFGNTVDALAEARSAAGVDDTPPADAGNTLESTATAEDVAAAAAAPGEGEVGAEVSATAAGDEAVLNAALELSAEEAAAAAAAAAEAEAAIEAAAEAPVDEAAEAAEQAFQEALDDGGSLVDAFRAAATASEEKGAEVRERLEQEEAALDAELGAALSDAEDSLDDLLNEAADAQEDGGSSGEPSEEEQAAVDEALAQDLNELAAVQAREQLASGFSRVLTEDELAEIKAAEAEAEAEAEAAAEAAAEATAKAAAEAAATAAAAAAVAAAVAAAAQAKAAAEAARLYALNNPTGTDGVDDILTGNANANTIKGFGGDDTLNGLGGDDTIDGGEGNDIITGSGGKDNLDGGIGDDIFIYNGSEAVDGEVVNGNTNTGAGDTIRVTGREDFTGVIINNMEKLELIGINADVTLTSDQIGIRSVSTGVFTDEIKLQSGVDQTLTIRTSGNYDLSADLPTNLVGYDEVSHRINLIAEPGVGRNFTLKGNDGANTLTGGDRNDVLEGGGGSDTLIGGVGDDNLDGGDGFDILQGGEGNDTLNGGAGLDSLVGGAGADILRGGDGDDIFYFNTGDVALREEIEGGAGADKIVVNGGQNVDFTDALTLTGIDVLQLEGGAGATFKSSQFTFTSVTYAGSSDQTVNIEMEVTTNTLDLSGLTLNGNAGNAVFKITGTDATETIKGTDERDIVVASKGRDTVTLGAGADKLKFTSLNENFDMTVEDFAVAEDKISIGGVDLLVDNTGAIDNAVNFADVSGSDSAARDLTSNNASIYEFSDTAMRMTGNVRANNAVNKALNLIKDGAGKELTVDGAAQNIFILYDTNNNAAVFYFENADSDDKVDNNELKLMAFLKNVAQGSLDASNFEFNTDPLIFDLDGDGVTLTSQTVAFDTDGDGALDGTTWFDSGDAMLVIDENGNGKIDGMQEVVSSFLTYGDGKALGKSSLDALAAFDDNGDGQITEADAVYSVLRLWNDANGDGVTDDGELLTLADFGITRIGLNGDDVNEETSGGTVQRTFEAEKADGEIVAGAEVSFESRETPMADDDPTAGTSVV